MVWALKHEWYQMYKHDVSFHVKSLRYYLMFTWLYQEWNDCRLGWNTTDFPFDQLVVSSERVWVPDITLFDR